MTAEKSPAKKKVKKASKAKKTKTSKKVSKVIEAEEKVEAPVATGSGFTITLSETLRAKVEDLASDEGIGPEEFIAELISEGVVVRAFDQWEKRQHLRGSGNHSGTNNQSGNGNGNSRRGNRNRNNNRKSNHMRYQNLMEDNSSFLEYVRNQEKKGGR